MATKRIVGEVQTEWASSVLGVRLAFASVAMEYYGLILNRTMLIVGFGKTLAGAKVHGVLGASLGPTDHRFDDPRSFVNDRLLDRLVGSFPHHTDFVKQARGNFVIGLGELSKVEYIERPKWGMGNIPHSGKLKLTSQNRTREFVLLGRQDGPRLMAAIQDFRAQTGPPN